MNPPAEAGLSALLQSSHSKLAGGTARQVLLPLLCILCAAGTELRSSVLRSAQVFLMIHLQ